MASWRLGGSTHRLARLSLDVSHEFRAQLGELAGLLGTTSITEAVRRSVAVTRTMLEHKQAGGRVLLRDADGTCREVVFT